MPTPIYTAQSYDQGERWGGLGKFPREYQSNYGMQLAYGPDGSSIYGVNTALDTSLFICAYGRSGPWETPTKLPTKYKAAGRVTAVSLDDRFYVAYRGTNDGVYLIYTTDFKAWTDLGRVGSKYAKSVVAPALGTTVLDAAKRLIVTGASEDGTIYYTTLDKDGKRDISWTKIEGVGTRSALAISNDEYTPTLYHTGYKNQAFYYQAYDPNLKKWGQYFKVDAPQIQSGVSAAFNSIVTYKGNNGRVVIRNKEEGTHWSEERELDFTMQYQTGLIYRGGPALLSFSTEDKAAQRYLAPAQMCEKTARFAEDEVRGWDCKWQQAEKGSPSGALIRRFFCCG